MQTSSPYGVYEPEVVEEVGRSGKAFAAVRLASAKTAFTAKRSSSSTRPAA